MSISILFLTFSVVLGIFHTFPELKNSNENVGYFWFFTDIHVHYEYLEGGNPDCLNDICCVEKSVLHKSKAGKYGYINRKDVSSKCDIPKLTYESVLDFMTNFNITTPTAVIFGGDIPAHDLKEQTLNENLDHLYYFFDLFYKKFSQKLPTTKIISTIGNHDTFPINQVDYPKSETESTWLLKNYTKLYKPFLSQSELDDVRKIGAYKTYLDKSKGFKVISLHSNYYCAHNKYVSENPHIMAEWLRKELQYAKENGEKVLIVGHIPLRSGYTSRQWVTDEWYKDFPKINAEYKDIIVGQMYGHFHVDYFNMVNYEGEIVGVQWVLNSVTNGYDNVQPAVRLFKYDLDTFEILDFVQFYNDLEKSNKEKDFNSNWKVLYNAKDEYDLDDMSYKSFGDLVEKLWKDEKIYDKFMNNLYVNFFEENHCVGDCKIKFLCMMQFSESVENYNKCVKDRSTTN